MKQLIRKPFLFALLLSLPLWVVFNNYIIAIISALLIAFLASMCHSLYVLKQHGKAGTSVRAASENKRERGHKRDPAPDTSSNNDAEHDA